MARFARLTSKDAEALDAAGAAEVVCERLPRRAFTPFVLVSGGTSRGIRSLVVHGLVMTHDDDDDDDDDGRWRACLC